MGERSERAGSACQERGEVGIGEGAAGQGELGERAELGDKRRERTRRWWTARRRLKGWRHRAAELEAEASEAERVDSGETNAGRDEGEVVGARVTAAAEAAARLGQIVCHRAAPCAAYRRERRHAPQVGPTHAGGRAVREARTAPDVSDGVLRGGTDDEHRQVAVEEHKRRGRHLSLRRHVYSVGGGAGQGDLLFAEIAIDPIAIIIRAENIGRETL